MGMNVYVEANKCECCNRSDKLHLAKLSFGRDTTFRGHQYLDDSWEKLLGVSSVTIAEQRREITKKFKIINEYDEYISHEDFRKQVEEKRDGIKHEITEDRHKYDEDGNYIAFYEFC